MESTSEEKIAIFKRGVAAATMSLMESAPEEKIARFKRGWAWWARLRAREPTNAGRL